MASQLRASRVPIIAIYLLLLGLLLFFFLHLLAGKAHAANPQIINFQGKVVNADGTNVTNGNYDFDFILYDDPTAGTNRWQEGWTSGTSQVTVTNGVFRVALGTHTALPNFNTYPNLYLAIKFNNDAAGYMTPRVRLTSVPYALNSDAIGGLTAANFVQLAQGMQTDASTTNASIGINKTGGTANILQLQKSGADVMTIANAGAVAFKNQTDSATAFVVQNAGAADTLLTVNTDTRANGGGVVKIGNGTGTDTNTTILLVDSALSNPTTNLSALNGGLFYNSTDHKVSIIENGAIKVLCNTTDAGCGAGGSTTLQNAYTNSSSPATVTTSSTAKDVIIKSGSGFDADSMFQVQDAGGSEIFAIDTTDTNLVTNGSLETNTTGWAALTGDTAGDPTLSQSTAQAHIGRASLSIATNADANEGAKFAYVLDITTYTLSFFAKLSSGTFSTLTVGYSEDGSTFTNCLTGQVVVTGGWTRFTCQFTTTSTSPSSFVYVRQSDATSRTFFIDAIQLKAASSSVPYREGGLFLNGIIASPIALQNTSNSTDAFQVANASGVRIFNIDTLNGGLISLQPGASLIAGQTHVSQTLTNASSSGGTVQGYGQTLTVANTSSASTTNGVNIAVTDNATTLSNYNVGVQVALSGSNTNQRQIGVDASATKGMAVRGTSSGKSSPTVSGCAELGISASVGVCGGSTAIAGDIPIGVWGAVSNGGDGLQGAYGAGVLGHAHAVGIASGFYIGTRGLAAQSNAANYTSIGVLGEAQGGAGATTYAGYFTLNSSSSATAGASIFATNSNEAVNIFQLQDNVTDVLVVADGGALTISPVGNNIGTIIKQTSGTATSGSILAVQTANGSSDFIQITNAAANEGAVTVKSVGATRDLTLDSGSGIIKVGSAATTLQKAATAFILDLATAAASTLTVTNSDGSNVASLSVEGDITIGTGQVYKVGATSGSTISTCGASNYVASFTSSGGIVTGGTCTALPAAGATSLDDAYNQGATAGNSIQLTSAGGGVLIQDAATTIGGNLFAVQKNTGSINYLGVTTTGLNIQSNATGSAVNALSFDTSTTTPHLKIFGSDGIKYADIYYDNATNTAYYGASTGTAVLGSGTGAVNVTAGAGAAFTITGNAASTISTTAGNLTLQGGSGTVSFGTSTSLTASGALTLQAAASTALTLTSNAAATWSSSAGNLTLQGGAALILDAASGSTIRIGDGTNNLTLAATSRELSFSGSARHSRVVVISPEYPGATMSRDGSSTYTGSMTSDNSFSASAWRNYYEWASSQAANQDYTIIVRVTLPSDFDSWATGSCPGATCALEIDYQTGLAATTNNGVSVLINNAVDTPATAVCTIAEAASTTWTSFGCTGATLDDAAAPEWDAAGETAVIRVKVKANSTASALARAGDITLRYLSKW